MSDISEASTPELGQVEVAEVEAVTQAETSPVDYVNLDEIGSRFVKVKIDGQDVDVNVREALSGYQRQSDYTRKTQELASQRESLGYASTLAEALERDPNGTIELLNRHYGQTRQQEVEVPEFADPLEKQVWELNQKITSFENSQSQAALTSEIGRLTNQYPDFNANEVIRTALSLGVDNLEGVYKQMSYDRVVNELNSMKEAQGILSGREQQVLEAKRAAAFVAGGSSANGAGGEPAGQISSVADAWAAAKRQSGF